MAGILDDIASDHGQFTLITNHAIMERALPLEEAGGMFFVDFSDGKCLESANDLCQGTTAGGSETRPYDFTANDFNDPVHVIRHDHEFV